MLNYHFPPQRLSYISSDIKLLKVLMFEIVNYVFALPISVIFKVINCPPITETIDSNLGIADFEGQTVIVVNLTQKLSTQTSSTNNQQKSFLILSQTRKGELCGITIEKSPTLIELPIDNIHPLPSSARQIYPLSLATHVAVFPKSEDSPKIFLLGMANLQSPLIKNKQG